MRTWGGGMFVKIPDCELSVAGSPALGANSPVPFTVTDMSPAAPFVSF